MHQEARKRLTKKQFDLLVFLHDHDRAVTQREAAGGLGISLGSANKRFKDLTALGHIRENRLTDQAYELLESYRVKRAVLVAAGFGSRLVPITLSTPKPLIRIQGTRIVDTVLRALSLAGIQEVYLVRGYLASQFELLKKDYPFLRFIENPSYNVANNISSALYARQHMRNAYVIDADLYLKNPRLITPFQYRSNILGIPVDRTDDWCLLTRQKRIEGISLGGLDCHTWVGLSYWTEEDGIRLENDLQYVYQTPGGKEKYWEQVPLEFFAQDYDVYLRECQADDIHEVDTLGDLIALDEAYRSLVSEADIARL